MRRTAARGDREATPGQGDRTQDGRRQAGLRLFFTERKGTGNYTKTFHTNRKGMIAIRVPSRRSAGGHTYRFWLEVVTQAGVTYGALVAQLGVMPR